MYSTTNQFPFDKSQAALQLQLLGYEQGLDKIYLRFIDPKKIELPHKEPPHLKLPTDEIETRQSKGYDIYFVVNGQGQNKASVKFGRAIFYEHDDLPKDLQRDLWKKLGLPEPSFQLDTGGKSIWSLWTFDTPIPKEQWEPLQSDLLEYSDADRTIKDASRVMRLAGSWYMKGENPGTTQATIISNSGKRYTYDELRAAIPVHQPETNQSPQVNRQPSISDEVPLYQCLTKDDRKLIDDGATSNRNVSGAKLARNLIGTAVRLDYLGIRYSETPYQLFIDYCQRCTPGGGWDEREWEGIWKSAQKSNPTPSMTDDALANCAKAWIRNQSRQQIMVNQLDTLQYNSNSNVIEHPTASRAVLTDSEIEERIDQLINDGLTAAKLQLAIATLARTANRSERTIWEAYNLRLADIEQVEARQETAAELEKLTSANNFSINIHEILPPQLSIPINQLATWLNLKPEAYLTTLLTTASSLNKVGTQLEVSSATDWLEPPQLYSGIVAVSSQKKSPILKAIASKPFRNLQLEINENFGAVVSEYEERIAKWDELKGEERAAEFPDGKPDKPKLRRLSFTQGTTEGLFRQLQSHKDKGIQWICDELAGLFKGANQYKGGKGDDIETILSMYDGTPFSILRADESKNVDLDGCILSIIGTIQPTVLQRLMKDDVDGNGQWARFCWVQQPLAMSNLPESGKIQLTPLLTDLYKKLDALPPTTYRLSTEAWKLFHKEYKQLELKRIESAYKSTGLSSCYGKAEGRLARLALNLHLIHSVIAGNTPDEVVPEGTVRKAIALNRFYLAQVISLYSEFHAQDSLAPHLLKVMQMAEKKERLKVRDVQQLFNGKSRPKAEEVRVWFHELTAIGRGRLENLGRAIEFVKKAEFVDKVESQSTKKSTSETIDIQGVKPVCGQSGLCGLKKDFNDFDETTLPIDVVVVDVVNEVNENSTFDKVQISPLCPQVPQSLETPEPVSDAAMTPLSTNLSTSSTKKSTNSQGELLDDNGRTVGEAFKALIDGVKGSTNFFVKSVESVESVEPSNQEIEDIVGWLREAVAANSPEMLAAIRSILPKPTMLNQAAKHLTPEQHAIINGWVLEQNAIGKASTPDLIVEDEVLEVEGFKLGSQVAHSDPYSTAYDYHGTVEGFRRGAEILVRWAERKGKPCSQTEWYKPSELRLQDL